MKCPVKFPPIFTATNMSDVPGTSTVSKNVVVHMYFMPQDQ